MTDSPLTAPLVSSGKTAAWVRALRPKQWTKNVLVFAAPAAAMAFGSDQIAAVLSAFAGFCLVASAVYLVNDAADVDRDRRHPRKRLRPIAAGLISIPAARFAAVLLASLGLATTAAFSPPTALIIGIYLVVSLAYSAGLKHQPIIDIIIVSSGFVLRATAGGIAADAHLSSWFLLVATFGSLLVVSGKRYAEFTDEHLDSTNHRPALGSYTADFLRMVVAIATGMTIITYCLWALENTPPNYSELAIGLSIVPFLAALLRYVLLVMTGAGGEPEEIFLSDRPIQLIGIVWVFVFGVGAFLG